MSVRDIAIVGGGPAGLATAIAARRAGLSHVVLEKGLLVNSLFHFPTNMVYFTTPELLEIGGLPFVTPYDKPTRVEALRYYRRAVDYFALDVQTQQEVIGVSPTGGTGAARRFAIETRTSWGDRCVHEARFVVLAAGAYDLPNTLGVPGESLPHVVHYYREAHAYYRRRVVIVGGKNSAAEAALELHRSGSDVTLVHRRPQLGESIKYWVLPDIENRIKEGSIKALFNAQVTEIRPTEVLVTHEGERTSLPADAVLLLTGYQADTSLFERCGIAYNAETCEPEFNPETLETQVDGLYVVGAVQTGRNSGRIFIENGRFHGEHVVGVIAKRASV